MNKFDQILGSGDAAPAGIGDKAAGSGAGHSGRTASGKPAAAGRVKVIVLDTESQEKYWQNVLTNAYYLHYPMGEGKFEPLRPLYMVLMELKAQGAGLALTEEAVGFRGKVARLKLEQGTIPGAKWDEIKRSKLPLYKEQLRWLFSLSVMGAAAEYVDLGIDFPQEWVGDALGKHGDRIASLRREILEEMIDREAMGKSGRVCFEVDDWVGAGDSDGTGVVSGDDKGKGYKKVYCLVPGKTGCREIGGLAVVELTPEEIVLVAEAQAAGMLAPGPEGARAALKWAG